MRNPNKLSVIYDKKQKDFVVKYPRSCDGSLAIHHLCGNILKYKLPDKETNYPNNWVSENFIEELERRGYDTSTLKFSIELKAITTP
jgi:predicted metal-dependent phosphotriesterase family hydrolase